MTTIVALYECPCCGHESDQLDGHLSCPCEIQEVTETNKPFIWCDYHHRECWKEER